MSSTPDKSFRDVLRELLDGTTEAWAQAQVWAWKEPDSEELADTVRHLTAAKLRLELAWEAFTTPPSETRPHRASPVKEAKPKAGKRPPKAKPELTANQMQCLQAARDGVLDEWLAAEGGATIQRLARKKVLATLIERGYIVCDTATTEFKVTAVASTP